MVDNFTQFLLINFIRCFQKSSAQIQAIAPQETMIRNRKRNAKKTRKQEQKRTVRLLLACFKELIDSWLCYACMNYVINTQK